MRIVEQTKAEQYLRALKLRVTRARVNVLRVLLAADRSLTHQQIETQLCDTCGRIDSVTVYRVLDWLVEQGVAHRIEGVDRTWRFAVVRDRRGSVAVGHDNIHPHFHCSQCDRMTCLPAFEWGRDCMNLPPGFQPQSFNLVIEGYCADCQSLQCNHTQGSSG